MTKKLTRPPFAEQRPHSYERHGYVVNDPWHWLKDARYPVVEDEDVLAYLKTENQWFEQNMAERKPLTQSLFQEMKARIREDDSSVPQKTATGSTGASSRKACNIASIGAKRYRAAKTS